MPDPFDAVLQDLPGLCAFPRTPLFSEPTLLEPMARLGMGLGIRLDIKRDDTLPLVMGGNKVRQLEFYLGAAAAMKADTVLITGAVQSNFVRLCAAGARKLGMMPVVQLEDRVPKDDIFYNSSGNVLLLKMLGAEIVHFSEGENEAAADANLDRLAQELREKGRNPYVVHLGIDHPPIGGLGYAAAACELHRQYHAAGSLPDSIVIPSGSGLTHAGFLAGARAIGWQVPVWGVCVRRDAGQQHQRVLRRVREIAGMLGHGDKLRDSDVKVDDTCLAPGYGRLNDHVAEAMRLAAHKEAILTDPVYSGRTLAGLIHLARSGAIQPGQRVTFIHTGGTPAIFGYQYDLGSAS